MLMALATVGVHTAAMLAVTGTVAVVACRGINPRWRSWNATLMAPANEGNPHASFKSHPSGMRIGVAEFFDKVWAAEPKSKPTELEQCDAYSQAEMRECLGRESHASNAALKRAEEQAAAAISKWDEDARFISLAKKKLRASNKAYEQYGDAQCAFASSLGGHRQRA